MKAAAREFRYAPPRALREKPPAPPSEMEVQALWFEQLYQPLLKTDDGQTLEIVQPGFWNHGGGPDFTQAVARFPSRANKAEIRVGNVEVHSRPGDWNAHGHHADPAYNQTILHVVWEISPGKKLFPATAEFRRVPQVEISSQLVAPWEELQPLCASLLQRPTLPESVPGRCSPELAQLPAEKIADILRAAGMFRLRQKALRWFWRQRIAGAEQALHEALAEALGFHANQIPMRLVAQRLPWKMLRAMTAEERMAHLFGLVGFLPAESLARLGSEPRGWLGKLWEIWWKARAPLDYALLPRSQWKLAGLRPLNRPERRLAALAHLVPKIPALLDALKKRDVDRFSQTLLAIRDPFWETHATLAGTPLSAPCRLIGEDRVRDILINVFWPMVSLDETEIAQKALREFPAPANGAARVATQRLLISALKPKQAREALVQQGLLQIFRDYCQVDCSHCRDCTFPELVKLWQG